MMNTLNLPIHHIGVACKSIELEKKIFLQLGFVKEAEFVDERQGVRGEFIIPHKPHFPQYRLELLENLAGRNILDNYLKNNTKMYHIAYESKDIEKDLTYLKQIHSDEKLYKSLRKSLIVVNIMPARYFARLCFVMLPNGILIELVEPYS